MIYQTWPPEIIASFTPPDLSGAEVVFTAFMVSDGAGGFVEYHVSDGVGGFESYQVRE